MRGALQRGTLLQVALATLAASVAETSPPEAAAPPRDPTGLEVHGSALAPRLRWTCPRCRRRNDTALGVPIQPRETHACRFCRRVSGFAFEPRTAA